MKAMLWMGAALGVLMAMPAAGNAADIVMRLGHAQPTKDIFQLSSEKFKEGVESRTKGKVKVNIYPSSQLGKIRDMIEGLRMGTVQVVMDTPSRLSVYTKLGDVFKLPYVIDTRQQGERIWASDYGKKLLDDMAKESGIEVVTVAWRGARHITSTREIRKPEDMNGLKIRVPPYDLPVAAFKLLGANPTPMEFDEVYLALQQKTIDAQENPLGANWAGRFQEVCKYLILTGHMKDFGGFMMGKEYLAGLPADVQKAVREAAADASKYMGDYVEAEDAEFVKKFREAGTVVIEPDTAVFAAKFKGFAAKYDPTLGEFAEKAQAFK